ncbi:hypothetical protein, partial [Xanthomonas campestris]
RTFSKPSSLRNNALHSGAHLQALFSLGGTQNDQGPMGLVRIGGQPMRLEIPQAPGLASKELKKPIGPIDVPPP